MKVLSIVGARPQFIKAFPLSRVLRAHHEEILVHTGQHYDEGLSTVFFDELDIAEPDYNLGVGSKSHAEQTALMMTGLAELVTEEAPDIVLVFGDTNSTIAGALVAAKTDPLLAHVEAGLRSHNWEMPEEVNRVVTDHCSDILFAPTRDAVENLRAEGIDTGVFRTGDVMYDAILQAKDRALSQSSIIADLGIDDGEYILATVHRAGNTDDPATLRSILHALSDAPLPVVFPVHPRTAAVLDDIGFREQTIPGVELIEPVGYLDFVRLLAGAERVATDSGGVQKEAFYLDKPCVTLREETEWVELVECEWNQLVGTDPTSITHALTEQIDVPPKPSLYGDGDAAERIVSVLDRFARTEAPVP